jgi:hypothetical protein
VRGGVLVNPGRQIPGLFPIHCCKEINRLEHKIGASAHREEDQGIEQENKNRVTRLGEFFAFWALFFYVGQFF